MNYYLNLIDISNIIIIVLLLSLSLYHLLIYSGRRKSEEEIYNIYHSLFSLSTSLYIFFSSNISFLVLSLSIMEKFKPTILMICTFGMIYGIMNELLLILNLNKNKKKFFNIYYLLILLSICLTFFNFAFGYSWYMKFIFPVILFVLNLPFFIITISLLIFTGIKNKLLKDKTIQKIFLGCFIFLIFIFLDQFSYFNKSEILTSINYSILSVAILFLTYALVKKFNIEYYELTNIRLNLESIVKNRTKDLETAKKEIETLNQEKTSFFINLAHEIKIPLTLISNYLENYINKHGNNKDILLIKNNFIKLQKDIVNFLDFEKLENCQLYYNHNTTISFSEILNIKLKLFEEIANKKNIKINSSVDNKIYLKIDVYALDRIINNLIDNAIKYTNKNGKINVRLKKDDKNIVFSIEDTGIGISENQIKHIFKPYHQLSHNKRNIQGIGMGLNIVKHIMDSINGKIKVESQLDIGSHFILSFPFQNIDEKNEIIINEVNYSKPVDNHYEIHINNQEYDPNKKTILLIDDNKEMLAFLHNNLMKYYNIYFAENGKKALNIIEIIPKPSLIISDIMMDEMDGYEFYNRLEDKKVFCGTPIVFLTAKTSDFERIKGLSHGAIDIIHKPFVLEELMAKINSIIKIHTAQKEQNIIELETQISKLLRLKTETNNPANKLDEYCNTLDVTSREKDVIQLLINGTEYKEISNKLNVAPNTVKTHIKNIYKKCSVQNKTELANNIKNFKTSRGN